VATRLTSQQTFFDLDCRQCPRLSSFLDETQEKYPEYHARPVAPFGVANPKLLIVGLAPGMHGANATGRPFTGDHAGILLYQTLYDSGFSTAPTSVSQDDGLELIDCRITNAVKCLPPQNKPTGEEIRTCNAFLKAELESLQDGACVLALGTIAHNAVVRSMGLKLKDYPFGHNMLHNFPKEKSNVKSKGIYFLDSYHCSRYNTQTRRLTIPMFQAVFKRARKLADGKKSGKTR
jgi:uracil-DNA glycosylase family 4